MELIFYICGAFFIGSFPSAFVLTKLWKGVDIRKLGTGNPGSANVLTKVGILPGVFVIVLDILKGALPTYFAQAYVDDFFWVISISIALIMGHCYSLFLRFKGGQGLATSFGVVLVLLPKELLIALPVGGLLGLSFTKFYSKGWFSSKLHSVSLFSISVLLILILIMEKIYFLIFFILLAIVLMSRQVNEILDRKSKESY